MTIASRDPALAARLDEYAPSLNIERQQALLAALETRLDARQPGFFAPSRQLAMLAGAAACAVFFGLWAGGSAAEQLGTPAAIASLLIGQGG